MGLGMLKIYSKKDEITEFVHDPESQIVRRHNIFETGYVSIFR
jgi:hypothetical protein